MAGSDIHLYTTGTPNGIKISITLEELGLPYKHTKIDISKHTQKEPWFLEINPNGRIPALTDTFTDGKSIRLFESGSIMQYLVARYDKEGKISYPEGSREHVEMTNWLFFLNAGLGPMQGQSNHFTRYAPEQIEYGINRYQNETRRLYGVLEKHLSDAKTEYLVGNKYRGHCALVSPFYLGDRPMGLGVIIPPLFWLIDGRGWISAARWAGVEIDDFPTLKAWKERMWARPGVKKGADVPEPYKIKEMLADEASMEKHATEIRAWVQKGMKDEAEKNKTRSGTA